MFVSYEVLSKTVLKIEKNNIIKQQLLWTVNVAPSTNTSTSVVFFSSPFSLWYYARWGKPIDHAVFIPFWGPSWGFVIPFVFQHFLRFKCQCTIPYEFILHIFLSEIKDTMSLKTSKDCQINSSSTWLGYYFQFKPVFTCSKPTINGQQ